MRRRLVTLWCLLTTHMRSSILRDMRRIQVTLYMRVTTPCNLVTLVCTLNTVVLLLHRVLCRRLSAVNSMHNPTSTARQRPSQNRAFSSQPSTGSQHLHRALRISHQLLNQPNKPKHHWRSLR
jgi:hypothetical protein